MKKFLAVAVCVVMMFAAALPVFAEQNDEAVKSIEMELYNNIAFGEEDAFQMRGFTVSPNGKYLYCGFLQANPGRRHISQYDVEEFEFIEEFAPLAEEEESNENYDLGAYGNDYPKSIAVDNRGYVFVGITHANTNYITLYCLDAYLQPVSFLTEDLGASTGVNGIATQKIGNKIYLYVLTCYDYDSLRRYDVTDASNIVLDKSFGQDGVINYNELTGSQADPGYLTVDVDGYIYLCYLQDQYKGKYAKGSHVMKIEPDGKTIVKQTEVREAYGICTAGDYLFVATHDDFDSCIHVLNKNTMEKVTVINNYKPSSPYSGIAFADGYLWVGEHSVGEQGLSGAVLRSSERIDITRDARETEVVETEPLDGEDTVEETEPEDNETDTEAADTDVETDEDATDADTAEPVDDSAAVKAVEDLINALPEAAKDSDKSVIEAARAAYNNLTKEQKEQVSKEVLNKLTAAEAAIKSTQSSGLPTGALIGIICGAVAVVAAVVAVVVISKKKKA